MTVKLVNGQRISRLQVIEFHGRDRHGRYLWRCLCDCGREAIVRATDINKGHTKSCGCMKAEGQGNLRHGAKRTSGASKAYNAWVNMKRRCNDATLPGWDNYGGRGITYDPAWEQFDAFISDMGDPVKGQSLERVDNESRYCKENCKWAGRAEQANNKRNIRVIEFNGVRRTISGWSVFIGVPYITLYNRFRRGWSAERALRAERFHKSGRIIECSSTEARAYDRNRPARHRAKNAWNSLRSRCDLNYPGYGARGIRYDDRWSQFENFYADMGDPPAGTWLDRIDNDGHYCKENCRWATATEQINNRRNTHFIEFNGERLPLTIWARRLGINPAALRVRLRRWPLDRALTGKRK